MTELWTTDQAATHLGVAISSVHKELQRLGLRPVSREPGRDGKNLFDADQVRTAAAGRPGQGRRTDLG